MAEPAEEMGLLYVFAYLISLISGAFMYFTFARRDKRLKFHSLQSVFLGVIIIVIDFGLSFIPYVGIVPLLIWIYGMYIGWQALQGEDVLIPVLGDYAKSYVMQ